jgi:hypothetical protein
MSGRRQPADSCAAARLALSAGLDGEASELERAASLRHAAGCPACQAFADESKALAVELRATAVLSPSKSLAPATPQRRRISRPIAVGGSAVAVLVAALLGAAVSARLQEQPTTPPAAELRIANANARQAQLRFQQREVQALLHRSSGDPALDRAVKLRALG